MRYKTSLLRHRQGPLPRRLPRPDFTSLVLPFILDTASHLQYSEPRAKGLITTSDQLTFFLLTLNPTPLFSKSLAKDQERAPGPYFCEAHCAWSARGKPFSLLHPFPFPKSNREKGFPLDPLPKRENDLVTRNGIWSTRRQRDEGAVWTSHSHPLVLYSLVMGLPSPEPPSGRRVDDPTSLQDTRKLCGSVHHLSRRRAYRVAIVPTCAEPVRVRSASLHPAALDRTRTPTGQLA